jgi:hypothetical protein
MTEKRPNAVRVLIPDLSSPAVAALCAIAERPPSAPDAADIENPARYTASRPASLLELARASRAAAVRFRRWAELRAGRLAYGAGEGRTGSRRPTSAARAARHAASRRRGA